MTVVTLVGMDQQRTPAEIEALDRLIWQAALSPALKHPRATWEHEGQEFTRLRNIAAALDWALGKDVRPEDTADARATFIWLAGAGPCPVREDGHTRGYRIIDRDIDWSDPASWQAS